MPVYQLSSYCTKKDKKLPDTKTQPKYFGPYTVEKLTKGYVVVSEKGKKSKITPVPLDALSFDGCLTDSASKGILSAQV